jgi:hypothetical protein
LKAFALSWFEKTSLPSSLIKRPYQAPFFSLVRAATPLVFFATAAAANIVATWRSFFD